ncbi:MAG: TetR/AcrR family transcriptional regulator [Candidatus Nanopelagicales bacterium]
MPDPGLDRRATPRQARARERVEAILIAAREIIEKEGVEPLSTQRIAKVAGIPVGSVYQFFPNKHSIVLELAKRSLVPMNQLVDTTSPAPAGDDEWWPWWETFLDRLIAMWRVDSSGGAIWSACAGTPELSTRAWELELEYARGLAGLLSPLFPHDSTKVQERRAAILARMMAFGLDCAWFGGVWDPQSAEVVKRSIVAALASEINAARLQAGSRR